MQPEAGYSRSFSLTDLRNWPENPGGGPSCRLSTDAGTPGLSEVKLSGAVLSLQSNGTKTAGTSDTLTVQLTGMKNYEDSRAVLTVSYTDRIPVVLTGLSVPNRVYSGLPSEISRYPDVAEARTGGAAVSVNPETDITVSWSRRTGAGSWSGLPHAPVDAGVYRIVLAMTEESGYAGKTACEFTIGKAPLTIRPQGLLADINDPLPESDTLLFDGLVNGETTAAIRVSGDRPQFALKDSDASMSQPGSHILLWTNKDRVSITSENYRRVRTETGS